MTLLRVEDADRLWPAVIKGQFPPQWMTSWDPQRHLSPSAGTHNVCGVVYPSLSLLSKVSNERHADRGTGGGVLRGTGWRR